MTQHTDMQTLIMAMGEVKGQVRELVHATNNNTQASNHMANSIAKLEMLPAEITDIKARLTALEIAENRRAGAMGFGGWIISVLPMSAVAAIVTGLFEFFRGKH